MTQLYLNHFDLMFLSEIGSSHILCFWITLKVIFMMGTYNKLCEATVKKKL